MFGRRNKGIEVEIDEVSDDDIDNFVDDLTDEEREAEDRMLLDELSAQEVQEVRATVVVAPQGPWELSDAPALEQDRLDLGSLHVPVMPDTDVRLEVSPEGEVVAATLVHGDSTLQLNAFAAPRRDGIWAEVLEEIRVALTESGGRAEEVTGPLGPELRAGVPTDVPGQGVSLAPARFLGVDGPRWFLRGLITGPAAMDEALAGPLLTAFQQVAVDRGGEAMVVREPLPLHLPPDAMKVAEEGLAADAESRGLPMPERGPEITETR